jgi:hypothetical protein
VQELRFSFHPPRALTEESRSLTRSLYFFFLYAFESELQRPKMVLCQNVAPEVAEQLLRQTLALPAGQIAPLPRESDLLLCC